MVIRIYMDTCCFNRPFDNQSQPAVYDEAQAVLKIQDGIIEGRHDLVWSYVLDREIFRTSDAVRKYEMLLWGDIACYVIKRKTAAIETLSNKLQGMGIKLFDPLHIACAVDLSCDCFITTDHKLLITPIHVINVIGPMTFLKLFTEGGFTDGNV